MYFDPRCVPRKENFWPELVLEIKHLIEYNVIRCNISIPTQKYILTCTFLCIFVVKPWKFLIWPPFWAEKRKIWDNNYHSDNKLARIKCYSMWNIHTNPNVYTCLNFLSSFSAKTIKLLCWPPFWTEKRKPLTRNCPGGNTLAWI